MKLPLFMLPIVAAFFAVACGDKGDTIVANSQNLSGVSATATGKAIGEPDLALLTIGVNVQRSSVEQARNDAAAAQQAVIDALKANGVQDKDVQTVQFSIHPQYDYTRSTDGTPRIIGYQVSNVVTAKIRDLSKTSKAIDDATRAGGNDAVVQGISFGVDNPEKLREQARRQAVQMAKAQAQQMADAAGEKLGKLISISESTSGGAAPYNSPAVFRDAIQTDVPTPIETGNLEISITVSVLYAIE